MGSRLRASMHRDTTLLCPRYMHKKTVLISGASSGIGYATAVHFQRKGWNVAASMRSPQQAVPPSRSARGGVPGPGCDRAGEHCRCSGAGAGRVRLAGRAGHNAGYGLRGPFEGATDEQVRHHFETNVFGLMAMTRAVLPHFRARKQGAIVNVASMGGRMTFRVPRY